MSKNSLNLSSSTLSNLFVQDEEEALTSDIPVDTLVFYEAQEDCSHTNEIHTQEEWSKEKDK